MCARPSSAPAMRWRTPAHMSNAQSQPIDGVELMDFYTAIAHRRSLPPDLPDAVLRCVRGHARGPISSSSNAAAKASAARSITACAPPPASARSPTRMARRQALKDRLADILRALRCDRDADLDGVGVPASAGAGVQRARFSMSTARRFPTPSCSTGFRRRRRCMRRRWRCRRDGRTTGIPIGVQIVGPWHGEDRLFDFAAAVEEGLGGFTPPPL